MILLNVYLVAVILIAALCVRLHGQKAPPLAPYLAATALLFVAVTGVLTIAWANPAYFGGVTLSNATPDGTYQDTYYVVVHPPSQFLWIIAALLPVALVWLQLRTRTMYHPTWVRWLFWPQLLGLMVVPVLSAKWMSWGMPAAYTQYESHIARVTFAYTTGVLVGVLALAALVALTMLGLFRRFGQGHPPRG